MDPNPAPHGRARYRNDPVGDGPYYEWAIKEKLLGRAIGIYQPNFHPHLIR